MQTAAAGLEPTWRREENPPTGPRCRFQRTFLRAVSIVFVLFPAFRFQVSYATATDFPDPTQTPIPVQKTAHTGKDDGTMAATINRRMDPVLVRGEWLGGIVGSPLRSLRLYRSRKGQLEPIRFQVDERTSEGDWIFPHGKKNNGDKSNGLLDARDVLLFMAKDAGERAHPDPAIPGTSSVLEIGIEDPVNAGRAWVYLAVFTARPPPLCPLPDYVRYNYETEEIFTDVSYTKFIITKKGLHTSFSDVEAILPSAGGDGRNHLDRMKTRIQIRFFFNLIPLTVTEEMLGQDVIAYITGPIRVIRRLEQFFKLPFGLHGLTSYTDLHLYERITIVPAEIHIPKGASKVVSSARTWYGADLSPNAIGSYFRNSENLEPLIIDGRMSEMERHFCPQADKWRVIYGPGGGATLFRSIFPPEYSDIVEVQERYVDDVTVKTPPERYPGTIGLLETEVVTKKMKSGRYHILMEVYFPPHYRPGDEADCLNVRDRPLRIRINGEMHANQLTRAD